MTIRTLKDLEAGELLCCAINPQNCNTEKLYQKASNALRDNELDTFAASINADVINYNDSYLLKQVVELYPVEVLHKIVKCKPDVNRMLVLGKTAMQIAFEKKRFDIFWCLIEAGADPNHQNYLGDTILHNIVKNGFENSADYLKNLKKLLSNPNVYANIPNNQGETPIAALSRCLPTLGENGEESFIYLAVNLFLELVPDIDLDTYQDSDGKSARDHLLEWHPKPEMLPDKWQPRGGILDYRYRLFYFLTSTDDSNKTKQELFICTWLKALEDESVDRNQLFQCTSTGGMTYLQVAIKDDKLSLVELLVKKGVDVNFAPPNTQRPIFIAVIHKRIECMKYLLKTNKVNEFSNNNGDPLLYAWIKSIASVDDDDLKILDEQLPVCLNDFEIPINAKNKDEETALHLAARLGMEKVIFSLLDHGAHLDIVSNRGVTPLNQLSSSTLKKYFDSKICKLSETTITMYYPFLCGKNQRHVHERTTDLLRILLNSETHQQQITHPLIAFMINAKWMRIRRLFYFYLVLAVIYSIIFTIFTTSTPQVSYGVNCEISPDNESFITIGKSVLLFFVIARFCFECFDCYCSPSQYFCMFENYLQLTMIILSFTCLLLDCPLNSDGLCSPLLAYSVLFVWIDLFFTIGKYPKINHFIGIFRTATLFLLKFIAVHAVLIFAFVFSFYVLFQKASGTGPFHSFLRALFKTLVMITGEFGVDAIPLDSSPIFSHILVILFMFFVSIVLVNLLIALTISATRPIEHDPFLYSNMTQIRTIIFIEKIFFNNDFINKFACCTADELVTYHKPEILMLQDENGRKMIRFIIWNRSNGDYMANTWKCSNLRLINDVENVLVLTAAQKNMNTLENEMKNINAKISSLQIELNNAHRTLPAV